MLRKIRTKETSKFHLQMCIAIFCMLLFFLIGIDRTENEISCTFFSLLIQYFTMASVAWMGAEAVLMFHKLIIVFGHLHLVLISVIAWGMECHDKIVWILVIVYIYKSQAVPTNVYHWLCLGDMCVYIENFQFISSKTWKKASAWCMQSVLCIYCSFVVSIQLHQLLS